MKKGVMMDWADRFIRGIYHPSLSIVWYFQGLMLSEWMLDEWAKYHNVSVARDYLTYRAWVI
jgi:hypothetical protein